MEPEAIRDLIHQKLQAGRLPLNSTPRFWSGPADGEVCDACDKPITKQQLVMEGIASTLSDKKPFQFHVPCFQLLDAERRVPKSYLHSVPYMPQMDENTLREQARQVLRAGKQPRRRPDWKAARLEASK